MNLLDLSQNNCYKLEAWCGTARPAEASKAAWQQGGRAAGQQGGRAAGQRGSEEASQQARASQTGRAGQEESASQHTRLQEFEASQRERRKQVVKDDAARLSGSVAARLPSIVRDFLL